MSFSYNPFNHLDVIFDEDGMAYAHCHGCGADTNRFNKPTIVDPSGKNSLNELRYEMARHISESHGRIEEDFEGWSNL